MKRIDKNLSATERQAGGDSAIAKAAHQRVFRFAAQAGLASHAVKALMSFSFIRALYRTTPAHQFALGFQAFEPRWSTSPCAAGISSRSPLFRPPHGPSLHGRCPLGRKKQKSRWSVSLAAPRQRLTPRALLR